MLKCNWLVEKNIRRKTKKENINKKKNANKLYIADIGQRFFYQEYDGLLFLIEKIRLSILPATLIKNCFFSFVSELKSANIL